MHKLEKSQILMQWYRPKPILSRASSTPLISLIRQSPVEDDNDITKFFSFFIVSCPFY